MPTLTKKKAAKKPAKTNKIKKQTPVPTLLSFILDESGSMESVKTATISGFNEYLNTMKKDKGEIKFTLTLFNTTGIKITLDSKPIAEVPELTNSTYQPNNGTPLYDAIGQTINALDRALKGKESKVKKGELAVVVTIMTDGEENASREFDHKKITDLIAAKTKEGWVFTFLGSNQDAWVVGQALGVGIQNSMTFSSAQTKGTFTAMATATSNYRGLSKMGRQNLVSDSSRGFTSKENLGIDEDAYSKLTGGLTPPPADDLKP